MEDRQLIQQYATWVHLNRMRHLADEGKLRPATVLAARQSTTVGLQFLIFLRDRNRAPSACTQLDIDEWLAGGPTTRSLARAFARWAMTQHHLPRLDFPYRVAKTVPIIGQAERLNWLRASVRDDADLKPFMRVAMMLLLLFAQPLTRIVEMKLEQIAVASDGSVSVTGIGLDPIPVMPPFDQAFRELVGARPNMNTAANTASPWLFPGVSPGRHLTASSLMTNIRDAGIDLRGAKNAALRKLVLEIPAALVADAFGYSYERAEIHSKAAGTTFADYAGLSASSRSSTSGSVPLH